jgi:hypothetical protein
MYCPWTGSNCDCDSFPYTRDGLIPATCEFKLIEGSIALVPVRKVSMAAIRLYKEWVIAEAARRKAEKEAQKAAQKAKNTA